MAKKRSRLPELRAFGAKLRALRGDRSREQISAKLDHQWGIKLDESTLVQYEKGTVWAPDAVALMGLSVIYDQPLPQLVRFLLLNRTNPDATESDADRLYANAYQSPHEDRVERILAKPSLHPPQTAAGKRIDLGRHSGDQASTPSGGGDVPASRERAPVPTIEELQARLSAAQDAALHLVKIITGDEVPNVHAARGRNATVRSGSRKARR